MQRWKYMTFKLKKEKLDLQVFILLLSPKISLILESCFGKVQRKGASDAHHSSNGSIEKFGWKTDHKFIRYFLRPLSKPSYLLLYFSTTNNTTGTYCSKCFRIWMTEIFGNWLTDLKLPPSLYSTTGKYGSIAQFRDSNGRSHFRISSVDSNVRTTVFSTINTTTGEHC